MRSTFRLPVCAFALILLAFNPRLAGQTTPAGTTANYGLTGSGADGRGPCGGLIQGSNGNFYGTTYLGGGMGDGMVFQITPAGALTALHSFAFAFADPFHVAGADGVHPDAGLVQGRDGDFYGTTRSGGSAGAGTVFKMTPAGVLTTLHSFAGGQMPMPGLRETPVGIMEARHGVAVSVTDGADPRAGLVQGSDGNFYGTTSAGGGARLGTIFMITPAGVLTTLHSFTGEGTDGAEPCASLVQGSDGNFYGTTSAGDGFRRQPGTVFKMTPAVVFTTLHTFAGRGAVEGRCSALVQGSDGNFYGTASVAGYGSGKGMVFKITPEGAFSVLHPFAGNGAGGLFGPLSGLIRGRDGNFYGTTRSGGRAGSGTIFKITPAGALTTLFRFTDRSDPSGALTQGSDGNFYGATGGPDDAGTVFKITPAGVLTTLHHFTGADLFGRNEGGRRKDEAGGVRMQDAGLTESEGMKTRRL